MRKLKIEDFRIDKKRLPIYLDRMVEMVFHNGEGDICYRCEHCPFSGRNNRRTTFCDEFFDYEKKTKTFQTRHRERAKEFIELFTPPKIEKEG